MSSQQNRNEKELVACKKGGQYTSKKNKNKSPTSEMAAVSRNPELEDEEEAAPITTDYNKKVRPYIDLIDSLRSEGLDQDISLPAVAVIGDQSSGKSSTLEAISGIQLPRGSGIVTRCPLVLRLKSTVTGGVPWSGRISYEDQRGEKCSKNLTNANEVETAVKTAQDEIAGNDKGISDKLITLDVVSADVPDLTLIDLPGITRVAVEGQPADIPHQIRKLIKKRIEAQETIILAVIPANVDIATTEALQMAQEIDHDGQRTLGIVTKPDLVDKGAEAELVSVITNQRFPLRKGYSVVKCRSQQKVKDGQSLKEAISSEEDFFAENEHFQNIDPNLLGVKNLSRKLTHELVEQIKNSIPDLNEEVVKKKEETRNELKRLGNGIPESPLDRNLHLIGLLQSYCDEVIAQCKGDYSDDCPKEMRLLTKTRRCFENLVQEIARKMPTTKYGNFIQKIIDESDEARGGELPRFMNYGVCKKQITHIIKSFGENCKDCISSVDHKVENIFNHLATECFKQFPELGGRIKLEVKNLRTAAKKTCEERINEILEMESIVYTQDRIYNHDLDIVMENFRQEGTQVFPFSPVAVGFSFSAQPTKAVQEASPSKAEILARGHQMTVPNSSNEMSYEVRKSEAQEMYKMIKAYMEVSTRRLADYIPLTIQLHLMKRLSENIRRNVMGMSCDPEIQALLVEDDYVVSRREALRSKLQRLEFAEDELIKFSH